MPVPGNSGTVAVSRRLLVDDVYDRILGAIYSGQLAPGEKLNDTELCAWLGTSRTPIRQALARLETQGLVETAANRWTRVTPISAPRYRKGVPVVASLYGIAANDAAPRTTAHDIANLREAHARLITAVKNEATERAFESLTEFATSILQLAENPVLSEALNTVMPRLRRVNAIYASAVSVTHVEGALAETIDALEAHDAELASAKLYEAFDVLGLAVAERLDEDAAAGKYDI